MFVFSLSTYSTSSGSTSIPPFQDFHGWHHLEKSRKMQTKGNFSLAYLWFSVPLKILLKIGSFRSKISFGCYVSCLLFRELNWLRVFGMLLVSLTVSDNYCNMSNANPQRELRELNNQRQWWRAMTNIESWNGRERHRSEEFDSTCFKLSFFT